jgi:hypothetical protein
MLELRGQVGVASDESDHRVVMVLGLNYAIVVRLRRID